MKIKKDETENYFREVLEGADGFMDVDGVSNHTRGWNLARILGVIGGMDDKGS